MNTAETPEQQLHKAFGLTQLQLDKVIADALRNRREGAFCEVFLQSGTSQMLVWDDGHLKNQVRQDINGGGVRVVIGDKTGYAFTDWVNVTNLRQAAAIARAIADHAGDAPPVPVGPTSSKSENLSNLYAIAHPLVGVPLQNKIDLLSSIDAAARAYDPRIKNVTVSLAVQEHFIAIGTSLGDSLVDKRPLLRVGVQCLASDGTRSGTGSSGGGGRVEFSFLGSDTCQEFALAAAKEAIELLSADPAPSGEMTVVLGSGWPGVLIHEAVGHGLEGDANRKGTSAFASLMGELVASPLCTVIDDGTVLGRRGSLNFDDEGTPTARNVLIENGRLVGYMQDQQNAALMGAASTGNGRRESYKFAPMPRMTNTFLAGGESAPEEIIASVKRGLYAVTFGGGQVNTTNGDFTFSANSCYLIEDGKLTRMVKGATLIGNGPKALHHISMVGNDEALDRGIGTCGKDGQSIPVCVGMPTVRIDNVTVGGTSQEEV